MKSGTWVYHNDKWEADKESFYCSSVKCPKCRKFIKNRNTISNYGISSSDEYDTKKYFIQLYCSFCQEFLCLVKR